MYAYLQHLPVASSTRHQEKSGTLNDQPSSPRLLALRDRLTSGDRTALDKFWKEISEQGAPMIEPAQGSDSDMLVTMLWRGTQETKNVFVFRLGDVSKPMTRLLDTDLWYKTFRLQKGARFYLSIRDEPPRPERVARHLAGLRAPFGTTRSIHSSSSSVITSSTL